MSEDYKQLIPKGYFLKQNKKRGCALCQRPEFRGEVDTMIWCRKYDPMEMTNQIKKHYDLNFSPREIQGHSYHFELYRLNRKEQDKEDELEIKDFVEREKYFLKLGSGRNEIEFNEDAELMNNLKSLSSELIELKLQGYENDDKYLRKMEMFRKMLELRYKQKGEIKDETKVSIAVLEIRELFNKMKEFEKEDSVKK